ncbi:Ig-like domain-containing protein [Anaerolineales bacterium HSG6]|nr:Ig-like domain-containing protein [Anaerolineales bacterium HSG6]
MQHPSNTPYLRVFVIIPISMGLTLMLILSCLFFVSPQSALAAPLADDQIDGTITPTQTISGVWGGVITAETNVVISGNITITPNTTIIMANDTKLTVEGSLIANGPITFTNRSQTPGAWSGIVYAEASQGDLDGVTIEYATQALIIDTDQSMTVTNSVIRYNQNNQTTGEAFGAGLTIKRGKHLITNNEIYNNVVVSTDDENVYGAGVTVEQGDSLISHNFIHHNVVTMTTAITDRYGYGGGIALKGNGNLKVEHNRIMSNTVFALAATYDSVAIGAGIGVMGKSEAIIRHNRIAGNHSRGKVASGGGIGLAKNGEVALIENNFIYNNMASSPGGDSTIDGGSGAFGGGIDAWLNNSATIINNLIYQNKVVCETACQIHHNNWTLDGPIGGGVYLTGYYNGSNGNSVLNFINNTVISNSAFALGDSSDGYGGGIAYESSGAGNHIKIANNIVAYNVDSSTDDDAGAIYRTFGGDDKKVYLDYNLVWDNTDGNYGKRSGSTPSQSNEIAGDPLFVGGTDLMSAFRLQAGSAAINKGITDTWVISTDYEGQQRSDDAYDVGFDELNDNDVTPTVGLSSTLTVNTFSANIGDTITYTVWLTNSGDITATGLTGHSDLFGTLNFGVTSLPPSGVVSMTLTRTVTADDMPSLSHTVSLTATAGGQSLTDTQSSIVSVQANPAINSDIQVSDTSANIGDTITYTVWLTNSGDITATGLTGESDLFGTLNFGVTSLPPSGVVSMTLTRTVTAGDGPTLSHTVNLTATADGQTLTQTETSTVAINTPSTNPSIDSTIQTSTTSANIGDTITYTVWLTNSGDITATDLTGQSDLFGTLNFGVTNLPPSGVVSMILTHTVTAGDGPTLSHTVNLTATAGGQGWIETETSIVNVTDPNQAGLSISIQPSTSIANVGDAVTYTMWVTNTGNIIISSVTGLDSLLGVVSFGGGGLLPNQAISTSLVYTVTAGDLPGPLSNHTTITATLISGLTINMNTSTNVFINGGVTPPVINHAPVANNDSYQTTLNTPLSVGASGVLGNDSDANHDSLVATLVSGPSHGSLSFNGNGSFSYTPQSGFTGSDSFVYKVNDGTADSGNATVKITVSAPPVDGDSLPVAVDDAYSMVQGASLTNSTVVANDQNGPFTAMIISQPEHGLLSFESDGRFSYTPTTSFVGQDVYQYEISNDTGVTDQATVTITVRLAADLSVHLTSQPRPAIPGTVISYSLIMTNNGPGNVVSATIATMIPSEIISLTWHCASYNMGASCTPTGTEQIGDMVTLPQGSVISYLLTGTIQPDALGSLFAQATVAAPSGLVELDSSNDVATDVNSLRPHVDLQIRKTITPSNSLSLNESENLLPGQLVTYTISYTNQGPSLARLVVISDVLPDFLDEVQVEYAQQTLQVRPIDGNLQGQGYIWTVGDLWPWQHGLITVSGRISSDLQADAVFSGTGHISSPLLITLADYQNPALSQTLMLTRATTTVEDVPLTNQAMLTMSVRLPRVSFSQAVYNRTESLTQTTITATLDVAPVVTTTVAYSSTDDSADHNQDYVALNGWLIFPPSVTMTQFSLIITDDLISESTEQFTVTLLSPQRAMLTSPLESLVRIVDNDLTTLNFSASEYRVAEEAGQAVITLSLSSASFYTVTADVVSLDDTALAELDYQAISQTVSFRPYSTVLTLTMPITDDSLIETPERLTLTLVNLHHAQLGITHPATVTIIDNEAALSVTLTANLPFASVDDVVTFTYTITNMGSVTLTDLRGNWSSVMNTRSMLKLARRTITPSGVISGQVNHLVLTDDLPGPLVADIWVDGLSPDQQLVTATAVSTVPLEEVLLAPIEAIDLLIEKQVDRQTALIGELLTYTLVITNRGPVTANQVMITDVLSSQLDFVSASSNCHQNEMVICYVDSLAVDKTTSVTITVTVLENGIISNTAWVSSSHAEIDSDANHSTVTTTVGLPDIAVKVEISTDSLARTVTRPAVNSATLLPELILGEYVTYTLHITNQSAQTATAVVLTNTLSHDDVLWVAVSPNCTIATVIICQVGDLAPHSGQTITLLMRPQVTGIHVNTTTIATNQQEVTLVNNVAVAEVEVVKPAIFLPIMLR